MSTIQQLAAVGSVLAIAYYYRDQIKSLIPGIGKSKSSRLDAVRCAEELERISLELGKPEAAKCARVAVQNLFSEAKHDSPS